MTRDHTWPKGTFSVDIPGLLEHHGLEARGEAAPLPGGEDNRIARIATDRGDVVIREYLESGIDKVRAELALVEHLAGDGFPTPAAFRRLDGEPVTIVAGNPIAVFPFVSGEVPESMSANLAAQCGTLLARLHVSTAGWADERIPVIDRRAILELAAGDDAGVTLAGADLWRDEVRSFLERNAADLALLGTQPSGPLHHDLHRQNLLTRGAEITAVLDFDELNRGPLILDLARLFHYLAVDAPDRRVPVDLAEPAIAGYESVRPLDNAERELLPLAFDLAGIVDASAFIMWAAPHLGLGHVDECQSWLAYLAGRGTGTIAAAFIALEPDRAGSADAASGGPVRMTHERRHVVAQHPDRPVVTIAHGDVRGFWRGEPGTRDASAAFLGIPFAKAPIGDLRFAAPVLPKPWDGVRDALEYGATAYRGGAGLTLIPEPAVPGDSTLNVNVFTPVPGERDAALPVLVWIHGGGYTSGSPASPWYDGRSFNRDGVVTVSVSYRLGFDGFGHISGAPSNRGVRDWLAALEWVRDNIAAFGGDPSRVTIAGQSAGGGAVLTLLGMPAAQHLFHSAWAMSAALADVEVERSRTLSAKLASLAGVAPTRDGFASVPEERLHALQHEATKPDRADPLGEIRTLLQDGLSWGPAIDTDLITRPTTDSLRAGVGADKLLVLGSTDDEFTMTTDSAKGRLRFVPVSLALAKLQVPRETRGAYLAENAAQRRKGNAAVLGRYATDVVFRSTVVRVAEARGGAPTWVYRFAWPSPLRRWSHHCLDVPFWFDCLGSVGVTAIAGEAPPRRLADALHGSAVELIRDGDAGWPAWSAQPGATRVFGGEASRPDVEADGYASVRALV